MKTARQSSEEPFVGPGVLERNPRVCAALTLLLLVVLGAATGTAVGLVTTEAVQWVLASVASGG